ncbi:MAG: DUF732 domain-containing protein [Acidimicrobiales bacterium]
MSFCWRWRDTIRWRRGTFRVGLVVLVATVATAGCGGGSPSLTSPADSAFLSQVHGSAPDIGTYRSDVQLIRLGQAACDGLRSGASYEQLADRLSLLEGSNALPSEDLGTVIDAAVTSFCPQYQSEIH